MDDDLDEEEAIKVTGKKNLENDIVDETLEIDEIVNIIGQCTWSMVDSYVLVFWIRRIDLVSFVVFGECRHGYAVSFLMDTAYWLSEQMVELTYKPRMHVIVAIVIRMQEDKAGIKRLMKEMEMMTAIKLFSVFHKLSQLQERKMFSVIIAMKKATMLVIVRNQEFVIQTDGNAETVPSYDAKDVSEVNASSMVHEQMRHEKRKTIIQTSDDDQIDSNIIFDDPYVESNNGTSDHDLNDHDEYHKIQMLAYDVQI
nr:hypothetical protein [Tanacetum cinerariifolium]